MSGKQHSWGPRTRVSGVWVSFCRRCMAERQEIDDDSASHVFYRSSRDGEWSIASVACSPASPRPSQKETP